MATVPAYIRAARTRACPRCGADDGETCRTPRGKSTYVHSVRMDLTLDAYYIGIEEGLRSALDYLDWQVSKSGVNTTVAQVRDVISGDLRSIVKSNAERAGV